MNPLGGSKYIRRYATAMAGVLPATRRRRQQRVRMAVTAVPALALAGLTAAAGLLLLDGRRRAAARQRLKEVAGSMRSGMDQAAPTLTGAARD